MKILFLGDIVGRIGREAVSSLLPKLVKEYDIDFTIANGENASHGKGLTEKCYNEIIASGVDCITLGNHWRSKDRIDDYIDDVDDLVRPLNLINYGHGVGSAVYEVDGVDIRVTNLLGQAFLSETVSNPYTAIMQLLEEEEPGIHILDFHAESTSEKAVLAYALDGKLTAVLGTHTHVQTNDAHVLPNGTAFCSDVGMCGAYETVIGFEKNSVINKVLFGQNGRFEIPEDGPKIVDAVVIDADETTGLARSIIGLSYVEGKPIHG